MNNKKVQLLVINAMIAAIYAVLTILISPIAYGAIQMRLTEIIVLLACYNKKFIPGLTIGCLYRLRAGGGIYLPPRGADGGREGQGETAGVDRFPDGGGDPARHPGGEGSVGLRQPVSLRLSAGQGRLPDGDQFLPPSHAEVREQHLRIPEDKVRGHFRGPGDDLRAGYGGAPGAGDPGVCGDAVLPGRRLHTGRSPGRGGRLRGGVARGAGVPVFRLPAFI